MRVSSGFSLIEAVIATMVVAVMFVAAMNTVGASGAAQYRFARYQQAVPLARHLMAEILQQDYAEFEAFGLDSGEGTNTRGRYDDVDDYDGWAACPPQQKDDTEIPGLQSITREVTVEYVSPTDLEQVILVDLGAKRITVSVLDADGLVASLVAIRTSGIETLEQ